MDFALAIFAWVLIWPMRIHTAEKVGVGIALSLGVLYGPGWMTLRPHFGSHANRGCQTLLGLESQGLSRQATCQRLQIRGPT